MESTSYTKLKRILSEARASQEHPIEGHPYHYKSEDQLKYIIKDAGEAAKAMRTHGTISGDKAEEKYLDQVNDASTVLGWRKRNGTPDWYKKKYLSKDSYHESAETGLSRDTLKSYMDKALKQSMEAGAEKISGEKSKKKARWKGIEKANVKFWKKV